jgi:hypothetical protein
VAAATSVAENDVIAPLVRIRPRRRSSDDTDCAGQFASFNADTEYWGRRITVQYTTRPQTFQTDNSTVTILRRSLTANLTATALEEGG